MIEKILDGWNTYKSARAGCCCCCNCDGRSHDYAVGYVDGHSCVKFSIAK